MPERLDIDVSFLCRQWLEKMPDAEDRCRSAAAAAFDQADANLASAAEVSIVLADNDQLQRLNRDYRSQDKPTNVLSFANLDGDGAPSPLADGSGPVMLGDIIVAYGVTVAEAQAADIGVTDHLSHLVVHGMLHLLGHDHLDDAQADRMEGLERIVLAGLGVADPYADPGADPGADPCAETAVPLTGTARP